MNIKIKYISYLPFIVIPFAILIIFQLSLWNWMMDDAGISIVFANNFINGYGFVPQPGQKAVEGFTNFLWVLLISPLFIERWSDPVPIIKIFSALFMLLNYILAFAIVFRLTADKYLSGIFLLFISVSTPVIVWTTSGLENPLTILLILGLIFTLIKINIKPTIKLIYLLSIISIGMFLNRPDSVFFTLAAGISLIVIVLNKKTEMKYLISFTLITLFGIILITLCRYLIFGDIVPNTFYAKIFMDTPGYQLLFENPKKIFYKVFHLFTEHSLYGFEYVILAGSFLFLLRKLNLNHWIIFIFIALAFIRYILLPADWMPQYRFAIEYLILFFMFLVLLFSIVNLKIIRYGIPILFLVLASYRYVPQTTEYYKEPSVPFHFIADRYGKFYNNLFDKAGLKNVSVLLPDMGGTLYYSNHKIYDLAGLCNKKIAKNLINGGSNITGYICNELQPDYIHLKGVFASFGPYSYLFNSQCLNQNYKIVHTGTFQNKGIEYYYYDYIRIDLIDFEEYSDFVKNYDVLIFKN